MLRRYFLNKTFAILLSTLIILISVLFFILKISSLSLPPSKLFLETEKVFDSCKVYFNQFGIPHIITKNENDAFFMMGYIHARDRIWQMDLMRRTAKGELSEVFGDETLDFDKFFRGLDLKTVSQKITNNLNKTVLNALTSYSAGVNFYLKNNYKTLPFEFQTLNYIPYSWTPIDCILIGRLMAFDMSVGFMNDITIGEIATKIGNEKATSLVKPYPSWGPCVLDDSLVNNPKIINKVDTTLKLGVMDQETRTIVSKTFGQLLSFFENKYKNNSNGGSNSWVLKKSKSSNGVILANDPHLSLGLPPKWYQIHLTSNDINVTGFTLPGIPFFLIGRNDNISWGITNVMLDDCDFFIDKVDSINPNNYYNSSGLKRKFNFKADTIKIKNREPYTYYIRSTERSSVISDFHLLRKPSNITNNLYYDKNNQYFRNYCLTYSWTGQQPTYEATALYQILKAKDWNQFTNSLNNWGSPSLNFTYADIKGNMGIFPVGIIPIRRESNPLLPTPTWLGNKDWQGFIYPNQLPKIFNPSKKFVASSNNKTSHNSSYYMSNYFEPPSRIERIYQIIHEQKEFTVRDVQLMQSDILSPYAQKMMQIVLPILESKINTLDNLTKQSVWILKKWDFVFSPGSVAPSIYSSFFKNLIYETFVDELGEKLLWNYSYVTSISSMKIYDMVMNNDSIFFDDNRTQWIEDRNSIVIRAYSKAIKELAQYFNDSNIYNWKFNKLQTLELNHTFSENKFLKPSVNSGPYQVGGNFTTISKADWKFYNPYKVTVGVSGRFIADMEDSVIYSSLPGGASGDPVSPNYTDQILLFLNSGYVKINTKREPTSDFKLGIEFLPSR